MQWQIKQSFSTHWNANCPTLFFCQHSHPTRSSAVAEGPRDASCQLKSCQLPRDSAETTCTTSPEQIEVMKLEGYSGPMCNKHLHSTVTRSSRFHCLIGVIIKPTTVQLCIYRRLAVAKFSKSTMLLIARKCSMSHHKTEKAIAVFRPMSVLRRRSP